WTDRPTFPTATPLALRPCVSPRNGAKIPDVGRDDQPRDGCRRAEWIRSEPAFVPRLAPAEIGTNKLTTPQRTCVTLVLPLRSMIGAMPGEGQYILDALIPSPIRAQRTDHARGMDGLCTR